MRANSQSLPVRGHFLRDRASTPHWSRIDMGRGYRDLKREMLFDPRVEPDRAGEPQEDPPPRSGWKLPIN